jgi:hypothetical protein
MGLVPHISTVGDAVSARRVTDAVLEGALAALGLSRAAAREPIAVKIAS